MCFLGTSNLADGKSIHAHRPRQRATAAMPQRRCNFRGALFFCPRPCPEGGGLGPAAHLLALFVPLRLFQCYA